MRIVIDTIPEDGVTVDVQLEQSWAAEVAAVVLEATPDTLEADLHLVHMGRMVRVRGSVAASAPRVCERCGEITTLAVHTDADLAYVSDDDAPTGHAEVRLAPGDLDLGWYHGGAIELADVLSEALALGLPPRVVCPETDACEGRVSALLEAANQRSADATDDGPFAALRQLT